MVGHVKTVVLENGDTVQFPRLTFDDLAAICEQYKAQYLAELVAEAKKDGLSVTQQWQIKQQAIAMGIDIGRALDLARMPKWIPVILNASLSKSKYPQNRFSEVIEAIGNLSQKMELCESLILDNAEVAKHVPKKDKEESEADFTPASPSPE